MSESEQRLVALREEIAQIRGKICELRNAESINICSPTQMHLSLSFFAAIWTSLSHSTALALSHSS